ncbi:MAG TPA: lactate permease LctP family transporter, partial [Candidatus Acidoferrum sp.]|nr:lactate permease LctP family transporter [Candidatus Acidoferrum sp.]
MTWTQVYDPFGHWWLSTLVAAVPILLLLTLLAGFRVRPHLCAMAGAAAAVIIAIVAFGMPARLAVMSFLYGGAFGFLKIVWIVIAAVFLYDISVDTGQFEIMKLSIAAITPDRRLQVLLVAFAFGAFLEGAAGFGAPVAIAGAFMIGLGFRPFQAAVLNLIANTAPVAWGAIGTPVHVLAAVTALPESDLSAMVGRILPWTAIIVPFWLIRTFVSWSETFEVFPAILVVGISFAGVQYFWSNHVDSNLVDIAAGIASIIATLLFLRVWQPKRIWRFEDERGEDAAKVKRGEVAVVHTPGQLAKAWMPFALLSLFVLLWGLPVIKTAMGKATTPAFKTGGWAVPYLHQAVFRAQPVVMKPTAENAKFDLNWLSATGTGCFL